MIAHKSRLSDMFSKLRMMCCLKSARHNATLTLQRPRNVAKPALNYPEDVARRVGFSSFIPSCFGNSSCSLASTDDELLREDLAGDEVMVQGIDCTSVSPFCCSSTAMGLVSVVYILRLSFHLSVFHRMSLAWISSVPKYTS